MFVPSESTGESVGPDAFGLDHSELISKPIPRPAPDSLASLPLPAELPWLAFDLPLTLPWRSTSPDVNPAVTANVRSWFVTARLPGFFVVSSRPPRGVVYCTELGLMMSGYPSPFMSSKSTSPKLGETPKDAPNGPRPNASAALGDVMPTLVTPRPLPPLALPIVTESLPRRDERTRSAVAARLSRLPFQAGAAIGVGKPGSACETTAGRKA